MEDKLHIGVPALKKAIDETFPKLGKNVKSEDAIWRWCQKNKIRKIDGKYAMYQSEIEKLADPNCSIFGLKGFGAAIGKNEDHAKYLIRTNQIPWIDQILGTYVCVVGSAENYRK